LLGVVIDRSYKHAIADDILFGKIKKNIEMKNHKSLRPQYLFLTDAVSSERAGCCC